jgi:hypothetical protein
MSRAKPLSLLGYQVRPPPNYPYYTSKQDPSWMFPLQDPTQNIYHMKVRSMIMPTVTVTATAITGRFPLLHENTVIRVSGGTP